MFEETRVVWEGGGGERESTFYDSSKIEAYMCNCPSFPQNALTKFTHPIRSFFPRNLSMLLGKTHIKKCFFF